MNRIINLFKKSKKFELPNFKFTPPPPKKGKTKLVPYFGGYTKNELLKELDDLKVFEYVLDNSEDSKIDIRCINKAINLIHCLDNNALCKDIYPNPHGTISFYFENKIKEYVSVEIGITKINYYKSVFKIEHISDYETSFKSIFVFFDDASIDDIVNDVKYLFR